MIERIGYGARLSLVATSNSTHKHHPIYPEADGLAEAVVFERRHKLLVF